MFEDLELQLIASLKRNLARHKAWEKDEGFEWEAWQAAKLQDLRRFRRENQGIVDGKAPIIETESSRMILEQAQEGGSDGFFSMNDHKVKALLDEMQNIQSRTKKAALRYMDDVYRRTVRRAALGMATGSMTLQQATDAATKDFLAAGITCIEYKDGRRVNIASYAEMALRTAGTRAMLLGEAQRREAMGIDTVLVSQYGGCSDTCLPWQGLVYIDDVWQDYHGPHTRGGTYGVSRSGRQYPLLSVAVQAGLFHPNCRHILTTWIEGVSRRPAPMDKAKIEAASRLEARQRELERKVRRAKRETEGLQDPAAAKAAKGRVRAAQKELREFVAQHGDALRRDYWRERYDGTKLEAKRPTRGSGPESGAPGQTQRMVLGKIDASDPAAIEALAKAFCKRYATSPVENMLVVTQDGEVHFVTDNNPRGVDCSYLGDKLKGSYNIHTHPPDGTQFSFSTDVDIPGFFEDGSAVMEAVNYKYRYRFERPDGITFEQWEAVRYDVQRDIQKIMAQRGYGMEDVEENKMHIMIQEICDRLKIRSYSRWEES